MVLCFSNLPLFSVPSSPEVFPLFHIFKAIVIPFLLISHAQHYFRVSAQWNNELNSLSPCCQALWLLFINVKHSVTSLKDIIFRTSLLTEVLHTDLDQFATFRKAV